MAGSRSTICRNCGRTCNEIVSFSVEDCDASAGEASSLGAKIHMPPTDIPSVGRFAVVEDPQEAVFTIIKLHDPE